MTNRQDATAAAAKAVADELRAAQDAARFEQENRTRAANSTLADRSAAAREIYDDLGR